MGPVEVLWDRDGVPPGKDMGPVEVSWDGDGVPPERTWHQWKYYGMEMGYSPSGVDKQTNWNYYLILRMRVVNKQEDFRNNAYDCLT